MSQTLFFNLNNLDLVGYTLKSMHFPITIKVNTFKAQYMQIEFKGAVSDFSETLLKVDRIERHYILVANQQ